jgi:hypothetical protein
MCVAIPTSPGRAHSIGSFAIGCSHPTTGCADDLGRSAAWARFALRLWYLVISRTDDSRLSREPDVGYGCFNTARRALLVACPISTLPAAPRTVGTTFRAASSSVACTRTTATIATSNSYSFTEFPFLFPHARSVFFTKPILGSRGAAETRSCFSFLSAQSERACLFFFISSMSALFRGGGHRPRAGGPRIGDESTRNQFSTLFWHVNRIRWPDL